MYKMKPVIIKTSLIIFLLSFISVGCKKSNESPTLLQITPESENAIIEYETNQIEFNFCLLNEEGQPGTVFNEGDNFSFSFSFKNNSPDTIIVTTEFINSDFYRVYQSDTNIDMGKPWTGIWCEFSGMPQEIKLKPSSIFQLRCPWILNDNNYPNYPLCMAESKEPLFKGEYNTSIDLDFHYSKNGKVTIIDQLKFKINFKVI